MGELGRGRGRARRLLARIVRRSTPARAPPDDAQQQLVEIARALGDEARILIMDEPTASLSDQEVDNLFRVIRDLNSRAWGSSTSRTVSRTPQIADRVTVLRDGALVGTRPMADVTSADLIRMMVGRELSARLPQIDRRSARWCWSPAIWAAGRRAWEVSLSVRAGEILGLAGLVGCGPAELRGVLFGLTRPTPGEIRLRGSRSVVSPRPAIAHGIAYVPEDRRRHGVILEMSVPRTARWPTLRISRAACSTSPASATSPSISSSGSGSRRPPSTTPWHAFRRQPAESRPGRWLAADPEVLILDEPTQGVDVGAKAEIHRLMGELAGGGWDPDDLLRAARVSA